MTQMMVFRGKKGILEFIRQTGCIQFDPVDVCGTSADIFINSRVKDYTNVKTIGNLKIVTMRKQRSLQGEEPAQ